MASTSRSIESRITSVPATNMPSAPSSSSFSKKPYTGTHFLSLFTPSIRARIYHHALVVEKVYVVRPFHSTSFAIHPLDPTTTAPRPNTALLRVCRQINEEALPIFLGENTFSLTCTKGLHQLQALYKESFDPKLAMIRKLELYLCPADLDDYRRSMDRIIKQQCKIFSRRALAGDTDANDKAARLRTYNHNLQNRHLIKPIMTAAEIRALHDRDIVLLNVVIWHDSLGFIARNMRLDLFVLNVESARCISGCCRLAVEASMWGRWSEEGLALPRKVAVVGYRNLTEYREVFRGLVGDVGKYKKSRRMVVGE